MIVELSDSRDSYTHLTALEQRVWNHASNETKIKTLENSLVNYRLVVGLSTPLFISGICFGIGITLAIIG